MAYFDRFDVCEAHYQLEVDYNKSGWLQERPRNQIGRKGRPQATSIQLARIGFKISPAWKGYESLTDNGKEIYHILRRRYGFDKWDNWVLDENGQWVDCFLDPPCKACG